MASIGLGLATGRQLWEEGRRRQEENERFLMGRQLYEDQLRLEELNTRRQLIEQTEATRVAAILEPYKRDIFNGNVEAVAQFLTEMSGDDNAIYSVQGNEVIKMYPDEDGNLNFGGVVLDTTGMSGPAMLSQMYMYGETTSQIVSNYRAQAAEDAKYDREVDLMMLDHQLKLGLQQNEASLQMQVAQYRSSLEGNGGGMGTPDFDAAYNDAARNRNWMLSKNPEGGYFWSDLTGKGREMTEEEMRAIQNEAREVTNAVLTTGLPQALIQDTYWSNQASNAAAAAQKAQNIADAAAKGGDTGGTSDSGSRLANAFNNINGEAVDYSTVVLDPNAAIADYTGLQGTQFTQHSTDTPYMEPGPRVTQSPYEYRSSVSPGDYGTLAFDQSGHYVEDPATGRPVSSLRFPNAFAASEYNRFLGKQMGNNEPIDFIGPFVSQQSTI